MKTASGVAGRAPLRARGGRPATESTGWRLISRMMLAALDARVLRGAHRLDALHEQPGHAVRHVEAMRVAGVDLDDASGRARRARRSAVDRSDCCRCSAVAPACRRRAGGALGELDQHLSRPAVAQHLEPRRRSRAARAAISRISASLVEHVAAVDRGDQVVRLQARRARRANRR